MKTFYLFFLISNLFFISMLSHAQSKYGNTTMEELNMLVYPEDTTASAVILLKKGESHFTISQLHGFQFEYTLQVKIKILKTEGLEWCNQAIQYYEASNSAKEQIKSLSGTTYNLEDGKIEKTKLSKDFITDEDQDQKYKIKKFTLPAAKVGSVIEFKYTIVSDFFYELRDFKFQESIPIAYTYYEATIPEYFRYNIDFQGYVKVNMKKEPTSEVFQLGGKAITSIAEKISGEASNIPAMKQESFLWTINDYISKISFELKSISMPMSMTKNFSSSWSNIDNELLSSSNFGGNTKKESLFKGEIEKGEVNLNIATDIQNMIKQKVKWNDNNSITPKNLKEALKTGLGNNADINFLLINALKAGGFDAFPVVLSTRTNGRLPFTHPSITSLNYVITGVKIDTVMYFTDAASKYGDWNLLPEKAMVPQARIIKPNACDWKDLTTISKGTILQTAKFEFLENEYIGKIVDSRKGNAAYDLNDFYYNAHKNKEEFIESLSKRNSCEIDSFEISNPANSPGLVKMEYIQKTNVENGEDYIYINPLINKQFKENPFQNETRAYPINFDYLTSYVQMIEIKIPENYIVEELPKPSRLVLNENDISLNYRIDSDGKYIKVHYQYQLKKLIFLPEEYESIRDFFAKLISKNSEQIVLKKSNTVIK